MFCCRNPSNLVDDVEELGSQLVSVTMVVDPFAGFSAADLSQSFPDVCKPFKEHHIVDLTRPPGEFVGRHHMRNARKAKKLVAVELCRPQAEVLEEWIELYELLKIRHGVTGIRAFSPHSFERQMTIPQLTIFRAIREDATVGMTLWLTQDDIVRFHLGAMNALGYAACAAFGMFQMAIDHFRQLGFRWMNLGAGAGIEASAMDGLARFKRGWSSESRTAMLCGRILNRPAYIECCRAAASSSSSYFPAYRAGEFG